MAGGMQWTTEGMGAKSVTEKNNRRGGRGMLQKDRASPERLGYVKIVMVLYDNDF
jgi:hypothetical protein